jgi:thiol:disulfide interchange protein DsbD
MSVKQILSLIFTIIAVSLLAQSPNIQADIVENELLIRFEFPEGYHQELQEDYFYINIEPVEGLEFGPTIYPEGVESEFGYIAYYDEALLRREIEIISALPDDLNNLTVLVGYQLCEDTGACLFPEEETLTVDFTISKAMLPPSQTIPLVTILQYLLMAFIGGILLNIMPCVLPVLSIRALNIVNQSHQDRRMILKNAFAYTGGILTSFIILAAIIIIIKISGELIGWGFQFQNIGFVLALIILIYLFALSLFDVFLIQPPGLQAASKVSNKTGFSGSFVSGIFAVLLATPCTAPLLGAALGFAFTQPPLMILGIFILIGFGMALPFVILGFNPKIIQALPKPGEWMNTFRQAMGFLLVFTTIYLLRTLYFLVGGMGILNVLLYLSILSIAAWLYGKYVKPIYPRRKQWTFVIIALVIAILPAFHLLSFNSAEFSEQGSEYSARSSWQEFSPELVAELRSQNLPVFIDFTAEWCTTCKTNHALVLHTEEIESAFRENNVQLLVADNTRRNPIIDSWLQRFGRAGVPLYILYIPGENEPVILPEIITKQMIYETLKLIPEGENR